MTSDADHLYTDRTCLRGVQYRTDANLAARQSLYRWQQPRLDLPSLVVDLAGLSGTETIADVGCGNGAYLAELGRREHGGPVLGLDLSAGMLTAAGSRAPRARLAVGDAAALPLGDRSTDVTLALHMLYHVPEPAAAVRELRRVTRPGGRVLVVLNGRDHLRELRDLIDTALEASAGGSLVPRERLTLDHGAELLSREFGSVTRHDFASELLIPETGPVADYVASMTTTQALPDPGAFTASVTSLIPPGAPFRIHAHAGCLVCT